MENPYQPPQLSPTSFDSSSDELIHRKSTGRFQSWVLGVVIVFFLVAQFGSAMFMLSQAVRLETDFASYPPRIRNGYNVLISSSRWMANGAGLCVLINAIGLFLLVRGRRRIAFGCLLVSIVTIIILAIAFGPA